MGATSGSVTCTKFYVRDAPKRGFRDRFIEAARKHAFEPLRPEDEDDQRMGFCVFERPFDTDIRHDNSYWTSHFNLGVRLDRWRIPTALFKAHFRDAEQAYRDKTGLDKLSRRQKEDLKVVLTRKLRRKTMPAMRVYDLTWDLDAGIVRFWNTAQAVSDAFEELFEKAFGHALLRDGLYISCERHGLDEARLERLVQLEPAVFITGKGR